MVVVLVDIEHIYRLSFSYDADYDFYGEFSKAELQFEGHCRGVKNNNRYNRERRRCFVSEIGGLMCKSGSSCCSCCCWGINGVGIQTEPIEVYNI